MSIVGFISIAIAWWVFDSHTRPCSSRALTVKRPMIRRLTHTLKTLDAFRRRLCVSSRNSMASAAVVVAQIEMSSQHKSSKGRAREYTQAYMYLQLYTYSARILHFALFIHFIWVSHCCHSYTFILLFSFVDVNSNIIFSFVRSFCYRHRDRHYKCTHKPHTEHRRALALCTHGRRTQAADKSSRPHRLFSETNAAPMTQRN